MRQQWRRTLQHLHFAELVKKQIVQTYTKKWDYKIKNDVFTFFSSNAVLIRLLQLQQCERLLVQIAIIVV